MDPLAHLVNYFGFSPAVGAYMAGLIVREEYFQLKNQRTNRYGPPFSSPGVSRIASLRR